MSDLVKRFLHSNRIIPYSPCANDQVKRLNGTLWKEIPLRLFPSYWEGVLLGPLHSVHFLFCTAINVTPHERFSKQSQIGFWQLLTELATHSRKNIPLPKYDPLV